MQNAVTTGWGHRLISDPDRDLAAKLSRLRNVRRSVDHKRVRSGAVVRGTDIPVHLIAGLARAYTVDEIVRDFPSLSPKQIAAAIEYAKAYPKRGRPFATQSLKRALGELTDLGAFEEMEGPGDASPQTTP